MTWVIKIDDAQVFDIGEDESVSRACWMVGITAEMRDAAQAKQKRDEVEDASRSSEDKGWDAFVGNLGEIAVLEVLSQGSDADRWDYVHEFETDIVRDGSLTVDVKTRDMGDGFGSLLCRRRYRHEDCPIYPDKDGAIVFDDDIRRQNHCVLCGQQDIEYYREDLPTHMYLLVHIDSKWEFALRRRNRKQTEG